MAMPERILLFDGECGMCNRLVQFLIVRDRRGRLKFGTLQGRFAGATLPRHGVDPARLDTACLVVAAGTEAERVYTRSAALLRALVALGGSWRLMGVFLAVPRPLRDAFYRLVAERRHRIFRAAACALVAPERLDRFLPDDGPAPADSRPDAISPRDLE